MIGAPRPVRNDVQRGKEPDPSPETNGGGDPLVYYIKGYVVLH